MSDSKLKIYSRYDVPGDAGIEFSEPSMTQQHFADECDVNQIIQRAVQTGDMSVFTPSQRADYYDASIATDYAQAMQMMNDVNDDFSSLPAQVRAHFGNDVSQYLAFMSNPDLDTAVELGLLERPETVESPIPAAPEADKPQARQSAPEGGVDSQSA